jgi:hypothetical protein
MDALLWSEMLVDLQKKKRTGKLEVTVTVTWLWGKAHAATLPEQLDQSVIRFPFESVSTVPVK